MNSRNTTKMVEHKLILFATVRTLWTMVTLLIKLFRILLKWKYTRPKLYHFGRYMVKAKLFCRKCFVPVTGLECSYGKMFIPVTESSVAKTEIALTGPARPLIWTHRYFTRGEISETKPARLTGLIWRGPKSSLLQALSYSQGAFRARKKIKKRGERKRKNAFFRFLSTCFSYFFALSPN